MSGTLDLVVKIFSIRLVMSRTSVADFLSVHEACLALTENGFIMQLCLPDTALETSFQLVLQVPERSTFIGGFSTLTNLRMLNSS